LISQKPTRLPMRKPKKNLKIKISTFVNWLAIDKWQYIYYALVAFNLLTVSSSLYLNHRIMGIYTQSIEVNRHWAVRLETYSDLGQFLSAINAPGNDIFDSQDVVLESKKLDSAQDAFQRNLSVIRKDLQTQVDPAQGKQLLNDLDAVEAATVEMVAEAQLIFSDFRQKRLDMASRRMAMMDRKYHQVNHSLVTFRRDVSKLQQNLLEEQKIAADGFRQSQFTIAGAMLLMMCGVTFYGHQLAQKMKLNIQEKEASITELQQAEVLLQKQAQQLQLTLENLQQTQMQLVQSEKMSSLGQMVAGIAHEVNNPVNFIHGNLDYVRDYAYHLVTFIELYQKSFPNTTPEIQVVANEMDLDFLQEDLIKILDSMKLGTDRIRQIVLSLRNFSRMDEADSKWVNIHDGIDSTLLILQHRLKFQSGYPEIAVIKDYGPLPEVECYAGQLNQVFMNILANAIDALEEHNIQRSVQEMKTQPSQITIRTSMIDTEWVEIAIADNGVGICEQIQNRIFDPFFTTKAVGKGTGMGMSISYQIITDNHHGKLKCYSTMSQGTEFVIQIPIRQQNREA
jgi:two-component system, NtrC family, sensor kinase